MAMKGGATDLNAAHSRADGSIRTTGNSVSAAAMITLNLAVLLALPLMAPHGGGLLYAAAVAMSSALILTHWALIHEAIHNKAHSNPAINEYIGRALSIVFASPFDILRFGHLMHHRYNRTQIDATDLVVGPGRGRLVCGLGYYAKILFGLYVAEVLVCLAVFLPRRALQYVIRRAQAEIAPHADRQILNPKALARIRIDSGLILVLVIGSAWLYGEMIAFWLALFAVRAFMISFFDNVYHYGTPSDKIEAAYNLKLPAIVERFMLYSNLHEVHHLYPSIPWHGKKSAFHRTGGIYHKSMGQAAADQFKGVIFLTGKKPR